MDLHFPADREAQLLSRGILSSKAACSYLSVVCTCLWFLPVSPECPKTFLPHVPCWGVLPAWDSPWPWLSPVTLPRAPSLGLLPLPPVSLGDVTPGMSQTRLPPSAPAFSELPPHVERHPLLLGPWVLPLHPHRWPPNAAQLFSPLCPLQPPPLWWFRLHCHVPYLSQKPPGPWPRCPPSPQRPHQLLSDFASRHI